VCQLDETERIRSDARDVALLGYASEASWDWTFLRSFESTMSYEPRTSVRISRSGRAPHRVSATHLLWETVGTDDLGFVDRALGDT
jgi:hypothetical protein